MTAEIEQLTLRAKKIEMQIKSIELLIGEDSPSVTVAEFQRRLKRDTGIWEREEVCRYMELSDGRFQYNWAEIIKTLTGETLTEREQEAMLEVLSSMGREEKRRKKALTETLLKQCEGVVAGREAATKNLKQMSEQYQEYIETADAGAFSAFFNGFLIDMDPEIKGWSDTKCETWTVKTGTNFYDLNWRLKGDLEEGGDVKVIIPKKTAINSEGEEFVQFLYNGVVYWVPECDLNEPEGSGQPAITNDWLRLYDSPTVSGSGRSVAKHPNAARYDWGMVEELKGQVADNLLPVNARNVTGKTPIKASNNLYIDDEGRYWVAVGPNVMNPSYDGKHNINDNDMSYGTKIDIHVVSQHDESQHYYIPAVIGDAKEHSAPDGLYQTGVPFDSNRPVVNPGVDTNTVEFIGYMVLDKTGNYDPNGKNSSITLTNNYKLIEIIVYDGIVNY